MTSCNGVSLKNIDKIFSTEEWLKRSPDAKEFIRKNRKPFTKRRRVSQVTFSDGTATTEVSQPAAPAIRQSRIILAVIISSRRSVYRVSKLHSSPGSMLTIHTAWCEIANHADTCCLGKNFIPLAYTNRVCDVHAFTDKVDTVSNILVLTGATAAVLPSGDTVILVIHQGLYFGETMPHSLINPNQIRANSIPFCDDPIDPV